MKKLFFALLGALLLSSCGVGSYYVSSGKADEAMLSFVSADKTPVTVPVDTDSFDVFTVKTKTWKKDRKIKETALNTIYISPGKHDITVQMEGKEVYHKTIFVSVQEHKIIEL